MVRNELAKTFLKEATREIGHLIRIRREAAGENSPRNHRTSSGRAEESWSCLRQRERPGDGDPKERLPASHAEGWGPWGTLCCVLPFHRAAGGARVSVTVLLGFGSFCFCKNPENL